MAAEYLRTSKDQADRKHSRRLRQKDLSRSTPSITPGIIRSMRSHDRKKQSRRQRHPLSRQHPARSSSLNLRVHGQTIKTIIHPLPNENHAKEERLRPLLHHLQKDQLEQHQLGRHR